MKKVIPITAIVALLAITIVWGPGSDSEMIIANQLAANVFTQVNTFSAGIVVDGITLDATSLRHQVCAVISDTAAADDSFEFWMADQAVTITSVGCRCRGSCSTLATFTLEDRGGNAMTITGTNPTCATTGNATYAAVTAGNALVAGEGLAFDVTNAVNPETDEYTICVTYQTGG